MKKFKKILITLIITISTLFTFLTTLKNNKQINASTSTIYVMGIELVEGMYLPSNSTELSTMKPSVGGYLVYSANTLMIRDYKYEGSAAYSEGTENFHIYTTGDLTIRISGINTITSQAKNSTGIYTIGNLTIYSDDAGTLEINNCSICSITTGENLTIQDSSIIIKSPSADGGILAGEKYVPTNANVTIETPGFAIWFRKSSTISDGTHTITQPENALTVSGFESSTGSLTVTGGTIDIDVSIAAVRINNLKIQGGEVTLKTHHDTKANCAIEKGRYEYTENVKLIVSRNKEGLIAEIEDKNKYTEYKYMKFTSSTNPYSITFDPGTVEGQMKPIYTNHLVILPESTFTLGEFDEFVGWQIKDITFLPNHIVEVTENLVAKLLWAEHSCIDEDKNHSCDICTKIVGEHVPVENTHTCDYCKKDVTTCIDEDKNHSCDICTKTMGEHVATENTHTCDYCKQDVTTCIDEDKNHLCDICTKTMGEHVPVENTHTCDYCKKDVTTCIDEDKNHSCDICSKIVGEHIATENTHTCDYCKKDVTTCIDEDKNHSCDICSKTMGEHKATENTHTCDYCKKDVTTCIDEDKDNKCDICEKELTTPTPPQNPDNDSNLEEITIDCASFVSYKLISFLMGIGLVFVIFKKKR